MYWYTGKYTLADKDNPDVYAYTRTGNGEKMLVLLNFTAHDAIINIGSNIKDAKMLLSNYKTAPAANESTVTLRPYESVIYKVPM